MKRCIYGVLSKYAFGEWSHWVYRFRTMEAVNEWLNSEEYDFCQREILTKTSAIKLAGRKAVENAAIYGEEY